MRERLVELIRTASHELTTRCVGDCGDCADKIADYLLENDVVIQLRDIIFDHPTEKGGVE